MFIDFWGGRGREREKRERERSVASHTGSDWGWNPQPFGVQDAAPTNCATPPWLACLYF